MTSWRSRKYKPTPITAAAPAAANPSCKEESFDILEEIENTGF